MQFFKVIFQAFLFFCTIYALPANPQPLTAIFLDIDGVLIGDRTSWPIQDLIRQKLIELYGEKERDFRGYTELQWRIAASHFLSRPAVQNLETLIDNLSKKADVVIVLSSAWRLDGSVDEIKHRMFARESFSKRIIDKTPDDDWWRIRNNEEPLSCIALTKYGFEIRSRADQIDYWIRENQERWPIANFVIIDDCDACLSSRFPGHFVYVDSGLFSKAHAQEAYQILTHGISVTTSK